MSGTIETYQGAPRGHHPAVTAQRDERRVKVAAMLVSHTSIREMARLLGCSTTTIVRDTKVIRRYWQARAATSYGQRIAEELAKLEELEKAYMPKARAGDLQAAAAVLKIMDRRAEYLGLDAKRAAELTVTIDDGTLDRQAIHSAIDELAARRTG